MPPALSAQGDTERVSVDTAGGDPNSNSSDAALSADGRYVAFNSSASDLVAGDTNSAPDVFLQDRQTGTIERISLDTSGGDPNAPSLSPSISADGRYVAFGSLASDLVAGDTNSVSDVFVHDRQSGTTERISVDTTGADSNGLSDVARISADGRYVAFNSSASDLVAGDANSDFDVFVHDREGGTTERVSLDTAGGDPNGSSSNPAISADGSYVAFQSGASDLVAGDANSVSDVFVSDRESDTTERVSLDTGDADPDSASREPAISEDGRYVAFQSGASDLVADDANSKADIFIRNRDNDTTERVSLDAGGGDPDGESLGAAVSADGRYVAFASLASDLVAGDANSASDVFVHDRQAGTTNRVSLDTEGADPDSASSGTAISADGRYVAFQSFASDLVTGDGNGFDDVFVHDFLGPPELLFAPPSHAFGARELAAGATEPFTLTVSNIGGGTLNIGSIGLGGVDASQFAIASHTCGAPLTGGESCDINVTFDPSSAGAKAATLDVVSDRGDGSSALSGQGTAPVAALAPVAHDFGARGTDAGASGPVSFTLSNSGTATLSIAAVALIGADTGQFAIASETCDATLAPGASCEIFVAFDPSAAASASATLSVQSDGGNVTAGLVGTGTSSPPPPSDPGPGPGPDPQPGPGPDPQPGPGPDPQSGPGPDSQSGPALQPGPQPRCAGRVATVVASGKGAPVEGTAGRDVIVGTPGDDLIRGGGGRDLICGRDGDDRVVGGGGDDELYGNAGADRLAGNGGGDTLHGNAGADRLAGNGGGDTLHGNAGNDRLAGNGGGDTLYGHSGADVLSGGGAGDELNGGGDRDRLVGGGGSDKLRGEGGDDRCVGAPGSDSQRGC
jgi:Tol biopolymer transport system component